MLGALEATGDSSMSHTLKLGELGGLIEAWRGFMDGESETGFVVICGLAKVAKILRPVPRRETRAGIGGSARRN